MSVANWEISCMRIKRRYCKNGVNAGKPLKPGIAIDHTNSVAPCMSMYIHAQVKVASRLEIVLIVSITRLVVIIHGQVHTIAAKGGSSPCLSMPHSLHFVRIIQREQQRRADRRRTCVTVRRRGVEVP